jgi:signal transduction histidine kinase
VREEERTTIARELHDELGKDLTMLTLDLAWLRERLSKMAPDDAQKPLGDKISTMEYTIQTTLQRVRRILSDLRPPLLDELGLKDAIEFQVQEFAKRLGIRYEFHATAVTVPANKTAIAVFRILQEILTNVARHAKASRIKVDLVESDSILMLVVEDNGCGIAPERMAPSAGFGILGIRERAWSIGGEIEIHRMPHSGTRVRLRVPLTMGPTGHALQGMRGREVLKDPLAVAGVISPVTDMPQGELPLI